MGTLGRTVSGALVLMVAITAARSGEEKDLRATIVRAIRAKGGDDNEGKYTGLTLKGTGTFYGLGEGIPFTGAWHFQGHSQSRGTLEIKVMDQTLTLTQVVSGDKGWVKFNDEVKTMSPDELAEEKAAIYAKWVSSLVPLKDKAFKLANIGEVKIGEQAATGVRVSHAGHRDINLFFDKTSGLLVKSESQVKDVKDGSGKEMGEETFFADFKEFKGIKFPTKITINRDGKLHVEAVMTDILPLEKLEEDVFGQP
jgi:hypothetical protein